MSNQASSIIVSIVRFAHLYHSSERQASKQAGSILQRLCLYTTTATAHCIEYTQSNSFCFVVDCLVACLPARCSTREMEKCIFYFRNLFGLKIDNSDAIRDFVKCEKKRFGCRTEFKRIAFYGSIVQWNYQYFTPIQLKKRKEFHLISSAKKKTSKQPKTKKET